MAKISITDDEILQVVQPDLERARVHQMENTSPERKKSYDLYRFQPMGNEREGFSQVVDSVAWNTVETLVPFISSVFAGDFFNLTGDDQIRSDAMKKYIRYIFFRKQNGKRAIKDWIRTGCVYHLGIAKVFHREEYDTEEMEFASLDEMQFSQLSSDPDITVTRYEEVASLQQGMLPGQLAQVVRYENVKAVRKVPTFYGPAVSVLQPDEFYYVPYYKDLNKNPFVAHRIRMTLDDVRRGEMAGRYREGVYELLKDRAVNGLLRLETEDEEQSFWDVEDFTNPTGTSAGSYREGDINFLNVEIDVFECYFKADIDGDGLLEPCICTICEDVILQDVEVNPYGSPPFVVWAAHSEPGKFEGFPLPLMLEHEQKENTNIRRLILDAAADTAYGTIVTRSPHMAKQWSKRVIGDSIIGDPEGFREVQKSPPSQYILRAYELNNDRIENKTGITKYTQGTDGENLNRTATGVSMIMNASQMRVRAMIENFAEAFERLLRKMIQCIQLYPPRDFVRVSSQQLEVNPDDLMGEYTIDLDVGVSPQEKMQAAQQMDAHVGFLSKVGIPMGLASPVHVAKAVLKKFELMGIDAKDLLFPSAEVERRMAEMERDKLGMGRLSGMIQQMQAQGVPPAQAGMNVLNEIMRMTSGQQGRPDGGPQGGGAGAPPLGRGPGGIPGPQGPGA